MQQKAEKEAPLSARKLDELHKSIFRGQRTIKVKNRHNSLLFHKLQINYYAKRDNPANDAQLNKDVAQQDFSRTAAVTIDKSYLYITHYSRQHETRRKV
jgi:hypothetical protein